MLPRVRFSLRVQRHCRPLSLNVSYQNRRLIQTSLHQLNVGNRTETISEQVRMLMRRVTQPGTSIQKRQLTSSGASDE